MTEDQTWTREGWAGVDSGRLLITDPAYPVGMGEFLDADPSDGDGVARWEPHGQPIAVIVLTGCGDGLFPVSVQRDGDGRITAVRVDFTRQQ